MSAHVVAPVGELPPGAHTIVRVGRAEIGVFNVGGRFFALPNVCAHQFGPLCAGTVGGTTACNAATGWRLAWVREGEILTVVENELVKVLL
jgi:nitrite reductase/ring-hydroxylating ferredoxin subunit